MELGESKVGDLENSALNLDQSEILDEAEKEKSQEEEVKKPTMTNANLMKQLLSGRKD